MAGKTYLITGAARGIGYGMFTHYVSQTDNTLIACVRDPSAASTLLSEPRGRDTRVLVVKLDASSRTDAQDAIEEVKRQGVTHIDVVISAAGIAPMGTVESIPLSVLEEAWMVNAVSVVLLYKAVVPLLRAAAAQRSDGHGRATFVFISAAGGSLSEMHKYPYPNVAYATSKAWANAAVVKMGMENEWLMTLCIHPGVVQTDMGNMAARAFGLEKAPITLEDSSKNTAYIIDNATKEEHSEKFFNETIDRLHPW